MGCLLNNACAGCHQHPDGGALEKPGKVASPIMKNERNALGDAEMQKKMSKAASKWSDKGLGEIGGFIGVRPGVPQKIQRIIANVIGNWYWEEYALLGNS